ncbi:hypothetical protein AEST_33280 [Alishewanella aestuarii B11]|uniref:Uncharacterized protein n=1 Tax=Alishewanella aestuarii B11 TaxID=1197174 RepID=J1QE77_9ALTE|nr:hypothetical protein AEST_33280 [Alishewanella aestuarii B11]
MSSAPSVTPQRLPGNNTFIQQAKQRKLLCYQFRADSVSIA